MSTESNKTLLRRWAEEGWMAEDVDTYWHPELVTHSPLSEMEATGTESLRQGIKAFKAAFSDIDFTINDMIAEGDKVVARATMQATHSGTYLEIPATGKRISFTTTNTFRIVDGKIAEVWEEWNALGFFQQLGAIPEIGKGGK